MFATYPPNLCRLCGDMLIIGEFCYDILSMNLSWDQSVPLGLGFFAKTQTVRGRILQGFGGGHGK